MSDNVAPAEQLPAELWMYIFEFLDSSKDLSSVVQTCRSFHIYAIRAMHRNIVWKTPTAFAHNQSFWSNEPEAVLSNVESLGIGISTLPDSVPGKLVGLDGVQFTRSDPNPAFQYAIGPWIEEDPEDVHNLPIIRTVAFYGIRTSFATSALYSAFMGRLVSFKNLGSLSLQNLFFTEQLFDALHLLPKLRSLEVIGCFFPRRQTVTTRDHSTLPITDLTMLNIGRQVLRGGHHGNAEHHGFADMDEDISYALSIASAHNLRTLRVDSSADVFFHIYRRRSHGAYYYVIPEHLTHLFIMRKRPLRGSAVNPTYHSEQMFPVVAYGVIERCPGLRTVSLAFPLPKHSNFPRQDTIPLLENCEGTIETISALTQGRPLKAISILRSETPTEGVLDVLQRQATDHKNLQLLSLHCKTWDIEVLDAICQLLPGLKKLRLTYDLRAPGRMWEHHDYWQGAHPYDVFAALEEARSQPEYRNGSLGPDEDTVVSFGPHYLYRLPHLHTAQIFATSTDYELCHPSFLFDNTFENIDEELRNLVIPWNRYCPNLREVQLHAGYAMRRGFGGAPWVLHRLDEVEENCDFVY